MYSFLWLLFLWQPCEEGDIDVSILILKQKIGKSKVIRTYLVTSQSPYFNLKLGTWYLIILFKLPMNLDTMLLIGKLFIFNRLSNIYLSHILSKAYHIHVTFQKISWRS